MSTGTAYIGTSGYTYQHWRGGAWYPEGLRHADELPYYAERFNSVELNGTHYREPSDDAVRHWHDVTPAEFTFTVKAHRYLTHMKKLNEPEQPWQRVLHICELLGEKFEVCLLQFPRLFTANSLARLMAFLELVPAELADHRFRLCCEFRHASWWAPEVDALLTDHGVAWCLSDMPDSDPGRANDVPFVFIRRHGPWGDYSGSYDDEQLAGLAGAISGWLAEGRDVYCYYNNDWHAAAPRNAARLGALVGGAAQPTHAAGLRQP